MALLIPGVGIVKDESKNLLLPGACLVTAQTSSAVITDVEPVDSTGSPQSPDLLLVGSVAAITVSGVWSLIDVNSSAIPVKIGLTQISGAYYAATSITTVCFGSTQIWP